MKCVHCGSEIRDVNITFCPCCGLRTQVATESPTSTRSNVSYENGVHSSNTTQGIGRTVLAKFEGGGIVDELFFTRRVICNIACLIVIVLYAFKLISALISFSSSNDIITIPIAILFIFVAYKLLIRRSKTAYYVSLVYMALTVVGYILGTSIDPLAMSDENAGFFIVLYLFGLVYMLWCRDEFGINNNSVGHQ
jgi:hypothetical protein